MRIGVDTGGTFTDLVLVHAGGLWTHKRLSTPDDPSRAVLEGVDALLEEAGLSDGHLTAVIHGSTVATNALLERKGARVALVTTEGFEDVLEIGRQNRPDLHALAVRRPEPVVPAERRLGLAERVAADGTVLVAPDEAAIARLLFELKAQSPESVAVVLLHSYACPDHEVRVASAIEAALDVPVTVSHRLLPEYREYERTSTCAINAYVSPRMSGYLARLEAALAARETGGASLRVMRSGGGTMTADAAGNDAVHTVLSGPAGGVVGAGALGGGAGTARLVTFDMGGTSTDVCLIDGRPSVTTEALLGGHPIRVPLLDIHTVGAGGGSIAWRDAGGALRVGPTSAGADPGPACYGRGGEAPTVTDANLLLGRLPASLRLAGTVALDPGAAHAAIAALAGTLGLSPEACAEGIVRVANTVMARAIRRISLERGHDPRRFALMSFGGAGGLHACELAASLAMPEVLVPPHPGLLSAHGMLAARPERELGKTVLVDCPADGGPADPAALAAVYDGLEEALCAGLAAEGLPPTTLGTERLADLRYHGQSYELTVPLPAGPPEAAFAAAVTAFHEAHARAFGYRLDRTVAFVTARVRAHGPSAPPPPSRAPEGTPVSAAGGVHLREALPAGSTVAGPASVIEYSATTFVPAGWVAEVLGDGTLRILPRLEHPTAGA
jgi:N-methylhydantoinase A